ncbi:MAG: amine dehydrogenase [Deltaproteobacteria bacterium]|nr:amine dehydrogenase [Deltaproteobacteria bacterium]MBW2372117.1 amine dehydrogenase [Deltaproteobacteria bacterium]
MRRSIAIALPLICLASLTRADLPVEPLGRVETLTLPPPAHWVWVGDPILRRTALVDLDDGRLKGMLPSNYGLPTALFSSHRPEIYVPETFYSRGTRGERSDVLTIYAAESLAPVGEVLLPPKRAISAVAQAHATLTDDGRFAAVFNMTPATSMSIVDLEQRRFTAEIATPGCSLTYAAGPRRIASLCMDGALLLVTLDDEGREANRVRTKPFFDPQTDPVTEKAARVGDRWHFVSFDGVVHPVDLSGTEARFEPTWNLFSAEQREDRWRIGGAQHLAAHAGSGRLYALVHQGGPDGHKEPGSEVWVYDLSEHRLVQRIEMQSPGLSFLGVPIEADGIWGGLLDWILGRVFKSTPALGINAIAVTQSDRPRLVTIAMFTGGIGTYDALSGEFLGRVFGGNLTNVVLQAPANWGGTR